MHIDKDEQTVSQCMVRGLLRSIIVPYATTLQAIELVSQFMFYIGRQWHFKFVAFQ